VTPAAESDLFVQAAGDEGAFAAATAPHERSLFRHCYRMLGSGQDAEEAEVAEALEMTPAGVNSALFRARQAARPRADGEITDLNDPLVRELLDRYVRAWHLSDVQAFVELVADDVRLSMPPMPLVFQGRDHVAGFVADAIFASSPTGIPLRAGWCNGQPAFATYEPGPGDGFVANGLQVLTLRRFEGRVVVSDIVSFRDPDLAARCGLPASI
jgi:hypothetical protein